MTRSKFVGIRITAEMQSHLAAIAHHYQWHTLSACFRGAVKLAHRLMPSLPAAQQTFQYGFDDYNETLPAVLNIQPEKLSNGQTLAEFAASADDSMGPERPDAFHRSSGESERAGERPTDSASSVEIGEGSISDGTGEPAKRRSIRGKPHKESKASKRPATASASASAKRPAATNGSVKRAGKRGAK